ncbi:hypothetical protein Tco_0682989 [Tanacetum coccineum]|uniref:Uncharacterized protein n=1 Tax=Tanacetum coccineum TaxID=301880 RepID=A0ABQ4XSR0_9ASTR
MSLDNASSTVTYTSVSFGPSEPSAWGISLVNADEIPDVDPYEEVAQQGQTHPLSPAYVPDPMELDEHVPLYALEPEHPEHHILSDDDIQAEDQSNAEDASLTAESLGYSADSDPIENDTDVDSIDYPNEPGTDDEDSGQDDDEDPEEDPSEEHESEDEQDSNEIEPFEEDEIAGTPSSPGRCGARVSVRPQPPMAASTQAPIDACTTRSPSVLLPPTSPTYDRVPLGHRAAMIRMRKDIPVEDQPPQRRFVITAPPPGCDVAKSSDAAAARAPRAADRAEDVGYVRALQASKHRMMTYMEEVNLRVSYQAQVRRKESEEFYTQLLDAQTDQLHEVRQAYLSSKAQNRALLARLETLETHISRMEWQRQRVEDDVVRQIMRTQVLEARARIDTVEDADSSC